MKFKILNRTFGWCRESLSKLEDKRLGRLKHPKDDKREVRFVRLLDRIYFNVKDLLEPYGMERERIKSIFSSAIPPEWSKDVSKLWMSIHAWKMIEEGVKAGKSQAELQKIFVQGKLL